ncbi:unnamed protein product [Mytilus coruscus]|uniref:UPAR/Ly6 domain-containing protein n=1 Tax=Mytilus coruscus TaxID=42192 RepID=A0A6J8F2X1_MYTCO|nr:unnamed protein product [Mytilus coruscus]
MIHVFLNCANGVVECVILLKYCTAVKCYECHEVDEPRLCTNVTQCPDMDHYCFTTRSFADNFKKIYKLGCAPKSICNENFGSPGKRDLRVDAVCCPYDQCNNRFPEEIQGSSYTSSTKGNKRKFYQNKIKDVIKDVIGTHLGDSNRTHDQTGSDICLFEQIITCGDW